MASTELGISSCGSDEKSDLGSNTIPSMVSDSSDTDSGIDSGYGAGSGSEHFVDERDSRKAKDESPERNPVEQRSGDEYSHFEIPGLASETATGMKEEIVLLSWLIVLLRTQDGNEVSFDWAFRNLIPLGSQIQARRTLSMDELSIDVQWTVVKAAAIISHHITQRPEDQSAVSREPPILTISSGRLFEVEVEVRNEDTVQFEICFRNKKVEIRPAWKTKGFPSYTISRYIERLGETIRMCVSNSDKTITECLQPTKGDINDIWNWNHRLPPTHNSCMHDIVSEQARKFPDKVGISSWDGNLTYAQIDYYSTIIAKSLINIGIKMHDFLPVCFEKSRWTIVAVLAAMKSGATFVLMDPTLPLARLQNMAEQVGATAIISSRNQQQLAISIIPNGKYLVVEEEAFRNHSTSAELPVLAAVPSSVLMYIIFTSGSTGIPKGVKISHETYTSSATPRAKAVGYTEESRVLDFASYAFDVSIDSMLLTLGNGGCLCIPSDEDRVNDINGVIRKMRINYAGLTPSVARILDPDVITSLSALGLGGEAASASDVTVWGRDTRIVIGYGPCECTIGCTINSSAATGRKYVSLGKGNGAAIWITDSNDHDLLMPVGSVGELLVEGPIVGQGYLNDPEKTAAAFINDPKWLLAGSSSYTGRQGRLYKTGDLGMYDPDGSAGIIFVGRKDTQVKLRGQRVELGEIESQLRAKLPPDTTVIAEVLVTLGSGGQLTLVIFLASESAKLPQSTALTLTQLSSEMRERLSQIDIELARVLPRYMVPTAYIPVNYIPALISGKTDRKRLKQFGATVDLRELERDASTSAHRELNDLERRLRQAWSQTLKVTPESIGINDNFFALGGDSLMAMKLVTMCRAENLDLTVASTFSSPTLSLMANVVKSCHSEARESIPPFSMCSRSAEDVCYEASQACHTIPAAIEDVYLCTPTQESLFTFSLKSAKVYVAQRVALIPQELGLDAWKNAWETVVTRNPILRTRLAQMHEPGLQQVVLKENISWKYSTHLQLYLEQDRTEKMELGESLARYAVVDEVDTSHRYMVWTVHHVLYDGWSEPIILQQVSAALHSRQIEITAQMKDFVRYVRETDQQEMQDYWRQELKGATGPQFPKLPSRDYLPIPDAMLEHRITLERSSGLSFTMAALIRGAWALVASQYTRSDDVVFGETLTGRDIALPDVGSIVGPLIGTVPVRIRIDRMTSVESYLQAVQQTMSARIRYQHMGMQNIRKVSQDAQYACEAGTGLVIQPEAEYVGGDLGFEKGDAAREALHFNPYPLMLACGIRRGGLRICASFDSSLIEISQMERMLAQLEMTCIQMINKLSQNLCEISCLSESEINQIWRWNQLAPLSLDASINQVRAPTYIKQQSIYPPAIVSWVCDPQYPSLLCPIGAVGEVWLEGTIVSEDSVDSPEWLVAGSSAYPGRRGRVHPTGDLVLLREDNSLVFVGRKEEVSAIQGHAVDIAGLEAHLDNVLPGATRSAVVISQPLSGNTKQEQRLLIFIEHSSFEEDDVELSTMKHTINASPQNFETSVCAQIPASLALTLKKVDKFIEDSLPSHLAPSGYIPLKEFPMESNQVSHTLLNQLASEIPEEVLLQLNGNLKTAWKAGLAQMTFTEFESILRSAWAVILGIELEKIDVDDNFFRLGGDSVLAMKLASNLRIQGFRLTVRDVFEHMRLGDAAKIMKPEHVQELAGRQPYKPLSLLKDCDVEAFLKQDIRPKLADQNWGIQDVSPVTYVQAMDVRATIRPPRTSIQYTILSFGSGTKREQLFRACQDLIKTHDILRTVFIEHESHFLQVVLHELAITITTEHTNSNLRDYVKELCVQDAKSGLELGVPFVKFLHVVQEETQCLILRLSHAQYDGVSLPRLLQDLGSLYEGFDVAEYEPYPSYIARTHEESAETKAIAYWLTLLNNSSLSILAGSSVQLGDKSLFQHKAVDIFQKPDQITIANILTAAWALLLARRLQKSDVTFGSISSGRNINGIYLENVQGPCYQFTPFRVRFQSQWTAIDLLRFVQRQSAESSVYDFLGFEKISTDCTNWSSQSHFFDSVVHYQDVIEDSDSMPFGGGNCQVDTWNPDGDAAHPLKIVSYVRGGQTYVGVVGSERDPAFVDTTLDEVASAVEELVLGRSEDVLLDGQIFSVGSRRNGDNKNGVRQKQEQESSQNAARSREGSKAKKKNVKKDLKSTEQTAKPDTKTGKSIVRHIEKTLKHEDNKNTHLKNMKGADEKEAQVPLPGNSPHQQRGGRQAREAKAKLALSNLQQDRKATDTTDTSLLLLNSLKAISKDKNADVEVFQQLRELASVDSAYGTNAYTDIIIRDYFRRLSVFTDPDIYLDGPILPARKLFHKYLADLTAQGKSLLPAWWIFSRSVKCHDKFDHVIEQEYPQIGEPVFKAQATNLKQMNPDTEIPKPALPKPQPGQPQNTKPDLGVVPKPPQKKRVRASGEQVSSLDMVNHKKAKLNSKVTDHNGPKSETSKPAKSKQQILKAHEKGLRRAEQRAKKASYAKNDTGKQKVPSKYNISERESNASETWNAEVNADWKSEIDNSFLEKNTL